MKIYILSSLRVTQHFQHLFFAVACFILWCLFCRRPTTCITTVLCQSLIVFYGQIKSELMWKIILKVNQLSTCCQTDRALLNIRGLEIEITIFERFHPRLTLQAFQWPLQQPQKISKKLSELLKLDLTIQMMQIQTGLTSNAQPYVQLEWKHSYYGDRWWHSFQTGRTQCCTSSPSIIVNCCEWRHQVLIVVELFLQNLIKFSRSRKALKEHYVTFMRICSHHKQDILSLNVLFVYNYLRIKSDVFSVV